MSLNFLKRIGSFFRKKEVSNNVFIYGGASVNYHLIPTKSKENLFSPDVSGTHATSLYGFSFGLDGIIEFIPIIKPDSKLEEQNLVTSFYLGGTNEKLLFLGLGAGLYRHVKKEDNFGFQGFGLMLADTTIANEGFTTNTQKKWGSFEDVSKVNNNFSSINIDSKTWLKDFGTMTDEIGKVLEAYKKNKSITPSAINYHHHTWVTVVENCLSKDVIVIDDKNNSGNNDNNDQNSQSQENSTSGTGTIRLTHIKESSTDEAVANAITELNKMKAFAKGFGNGNLKDYFALLPKEEQTALMKTLDEEISETSSLEQRKLINGLKTGLNYSAIEAINVYFDLVLNIQGYKGKVVMFVNPLTRSVSLKLFGCAYQRRLDLF